MKMERRHDQMIRSPGCSPSSPSSSSALASSPTTFVQADVTSFRDLVQKLTGLGSDDSRKLISPSSHNLAVDFIGPRRPPFKLQERRHGLRKLDVKLGLSCLSNSSSSPPPTQNNIPSPVTPLCSEFLFFPGAESPSSSTVSEEEKAIAEKGFFLHPSLNTPRTSKPPELLTLFPLSSPSGDQTQQD